MKPKSSGRHPDQHDTEIGARIRLRRRTLGISQAVLADSLGLTFQQVQKYERGANRVSASMLSRIATTLKCPASALMGENESGGPDAPIPQLNTPHAIKLLEAFGTIGSDDLRRRIVDMVVGLAAYDANTKGAAPAAVQAPAITPPVKTLARAAKARSPAPKRATMASSRAAKPAPAANRSPAAVQTVALKAPEATPPAAPAPAVEKSDKKTRLSRARRLRDDPDPPWRRRSKRKTR